jgi:hypothetical protein
MLLQVIRATNMEWLIINAKLNNQTKLQDSTQQ